MRDIPLKLLILPILICFMPLFCQAGGIEDANAVLIKTLELSGGETLLSRPMSIAEIESKEMFEISKCKDCQQVPFGVDNSYWEEFKDGYADGDIILYFSTNDPTGKNPYGQEGYALIRGKSLVDIFFKKE